jgi:hypothetical protein
MSSPLTTQTPARQQHPRGRLVGFNLLSLKQMEKSPGNHRAFLFLEAINGAQLLCLDKFSCNLFGMTILHTQRARKSLILYIYPHAT